MRRFNAALSGLRILLLAGFAVLLAACNGSDDSSSTTPTSSTLSGTAAIGAPIDGYVYVVDSNGMEVNTATNATTGAWTVSVSGMTAPFLIRAVPTGGGDTLYSYAGAANITVNITPLTHLALYLAHNSDLSALYTNWAANNSQLTAQALLNAQAIINANFAAELDGEGLDHASYDFFGDDFTANGTGIDAFLDSLNISIDFTGGTYTILVGGIAFSFDTAIDTSGINIGGGSGGNTGGTLPSGVAGQSVTMEYCCATTGSPYSNGEQVLFTFSSSGALTLTNQYTLVSHTFTVNTSGEYVWTDAGSGLSYVLSVLNGAIHEVNVFDGSVFMGQFTPVSGANNGGGSTSISCDISQYVTGAISEPTAAEVASFAGTYTGQEGAYGPNPGDPFVATGSASFVLNADGTATYNGVDYAITSYCLDNSVSLLYVMDASGSHFDLFGNGDLAGVTPNGDIALSAGLQ